MKNLVLTLVAALLVSVSTHAQNMTFGLKAGINLADQDYKSDGFEISPDSRVAFHAGVFMTYMFNDRIGVQPELLYNQEGSKWKMSGSKSTVKMDYVSLPILARFQPIEIFNIHAGPQFSYRVNAESGGEDLDDETEDIEIGAAVGVGLDLNVGFGLTVRYVFGLSDAFDASDVTVKNNVLQASITYRFGGAR